MIDVNPNHLDTVTRILAGHVPECEARAFGSRVTWTAKDYSDLDLAVVGERALDSDALRHLKEAFEESDLPFRVDVLDWHAISSAFRKVIEKKYEVVQKGKQKSLGMPGEWRASTWGEEISLEYGKALRSHDEAQGPYRVFGSNGPIGWTSEPLARGPGVILGRKGAYRGVQYSREPFFVIDTAYYIVPKTELDMRWLFYAVKHYKLGEVDDGSPIPSTTRAAVYMLDLDVPPPDEQRAIAHILGTLDDKIELNRRMSETLEAMARALFKSWFVDFDPVRAKAEGRNPGLPQPLADLFPARLVDSELGEIPEGWAVGTLADFSSLNPEAWSKETRPAVINYIDLSNTKWGRIEAVTAYAQQDAPSRAQRVLRPRDTIVGTVRPGNGSYAFISEDGLTGSTGFAVLRPLRSTYAEFVHLASTSGDNIEALSHLADGGAYPAIRPEVVAGTQVIRPTEDILQNFSRAVAPLLEKNAGNVSESRILAALRDTLLPKLISSELRLPAALRDRAARQAGVKDAERFVERMV